MADAKGSVAVNQTTSGRAPLSPLLTAPGKTWHNMSLLNEKAGFVVKYRKWLSPNEPAEPHLFSSCLRGVKELAKFGLLKPIEGDPAKIADTLSSHMDVQRLMGCLVWQKRVISDPPSNRVFWEVTKDDPMAPVLLQLVTEGRLKKACEACVARGDLDRMPPIPRQLESLWERIPKGDSLPNNTPSQALSTTAGGSGKS